MSNINRDEFYFNALDIFENFLYLIGKREDEIKDLYRRLEDRDRIISEYQKSTPGLINQDDEEDSEKCNVEFRTIVASKIPAMRTRLRKILSRDGNCRIVAEAENSAELLEKFHKHKPKLVVADLDLPTSEEGYNALREIRTKYPDAAIIIISKDVSEGILLQVIDIRPDDIISKPINHLRLVTNVQKIRERDQSA